MVMTNPGSLIRKGLKGALSVVRIAFGHAKIFKRTGPREFLRFQQRAKQALSVPHKVFPNGITTDLPLGAALNWHTLHPERIILVLMGSTDNPALARWLDEARRVMLTHFLVSSQLSTTRPFLGADDVTACEFVEAADTSSLPALVSFLQQRWRKCDVVLIDVTQPLIPILDIVRLRHAAYTYDIEGELGAVTPAYSTAARTAAGFDFDRWSSSWVEAGPTRTEHGQAAIPRYVLSCGVHGFYLTHRMMDRINVHAGPSVSLAMPNQVAHFVMQGWKQNWRTLVFSPVVVRVNDLPVLEMSEDQLAWLTNRRVVDETGRRRVIFVLNATSISGGIRTVFEQANGLSRRGFAVEVWSLEEAPTWTELVVPVRTFRSYYDLMVALRNEQAIKVATWWETGQVVWLASVNNGVPVQFVQEFETWFYPDDPIARAAVVSSYRREFAYLTTAEFQFDELEAIGVHPTLIPVGYEVEYYRPLTGVKRRDDAVLAIGRSFFQKNFAMTLRAWSSLGDKRPQLVLFGGEPRIVDDERAEYWTTPDNATVNRLYNEATCFVQTSRHEGFSLPVIEAMAAGCPVITTDSHGNRGFCYDEVNCLIVEQDDDAGLARAIDRLMGDVSLQERLRVAGLKTAAEFTWSVIFDELEGFYSRL
jgi:glycosyltransferase involved in cell wall biosynthesis